MWPTRELRIKRSCFLWVGRRGLGLRGFLPDVRGPNPFLCESVLDWVDARNGYDAHGGDDNIVKDRAYCYGTERGRSTGTRDKDQRSTCLD